MGELAIVCALLFIVYEDFRYRAIHWAWLVVLVGGILASYQLDFFSVAINLLLFCIQLLVLTIYFSLKHGRLVSLPKEHLGWGDILFYIPLAMVFSPENLIVFCVLSFSITILSFGLYQIAKKQQTPTIPLAGCLSIFLLLF